MKSTNGLRYHVLLRLAQGALLWEAVWQRVWPAFAVVGVFLALAFLDVFPSLPPWLHAALLAGFFILFFVMLARGLPGIRLADRLAARHRLEKDSGLDHRPLTALQDNLASGQGDRETEALWQVHLERMRRAAADLRVRAPTPDVARRDPWAFRAVAVLLLVIGVAAAGSNMSGRLAAAFLPDFAGTPDRPVQLELWINPPAYTRVAPIYLNLGTVTESPLVVPEGSVLLAQVSNVTPGPILTIGGRQQAFDPLGPTGEAGTYRLESEIETGDRLAILVEEVELAAWPIEVVPDGPPEVSFSEPPDATERAQLRLTFEARDDYGVSELVAVLTRVGREPQTEADSLRLELPVSGSNRRETKGRSLHDLTAHLWAGWPVRGVLQATDQRGQVGRSETVEFVLPEREFIHPVARAIIAERKKLADPTPQVRQEVVDGLARIANQPQQFGDDTVVFLALSVSRSRLIHDERGVAIAAVARVLWDTALRLEEGGMSLVERDLQRLHEELMEALREGAESEEIERLMDELQRAMNEFMAELAEQLRQMMPMDMPIDPNAEIMESTDLQRMLDEIRDLARMGAMEAARQRLAELQRMLENMRSAMRAGPQQQMQQSRQAQEAQRMLQALRELAQRQQSLLDETYRQMREALANRQQGQGQQDLRQQRQQGQPGQQGQRGQQPGQQGQRGQGSNPDFGLGSEFQEALRRQLGQMMLDLDAMMGQIPPALGEAERAMRRATDALRQGSGDEAVQAQTEALEHLRSGGNQAAQQMAQQMMGAMSMPGMMMMLRGQQRPLMPFGRQPDRDPFGRRTDGVSGFATDDNVEVPNEMERRRAHEILRELQKRAGERERPKFELDYIERLLERF